MSNPLKKLPAQFASLLIGITLCGCAAQTAYRDGKTLAAQDKVEEGLSKFQEALEYDPRNVEYLAAYRQTREKAITRYLDQAERLATAGQRDQAEKQYQRVLSMDASNERTR